MLFKFAPIQTSAMMLASLAICSAAHAESPHVEASIPQSWALKAATAASEKCLEMGFAATVTVVDQRAQPRVQLMREGAFPHTVETSRRKAITAASRREATSVIEAENAHEPTLGAVFNQIGLITLSGGLPIYHGGAVIGGIGISGAPGEDDQDRDYDEICGNAGLAAIAHLLQGGDPPTQTHHPATPKDRTEIADQIAKYAQLWDRKDAEAFAQLFTDDGTLEWYFGGVRHPQGPVQGRSEIQKYAASAYEGRLAGRQSRHHFSNLVFGELTADSARTEHTFLVTHVAPGEQPFVRSTGFYRIEWRKTADGWLITKRELHVDR